MLAAALHVRRSAVAPRRFPAAWVLLAGATLLATGCVAEARSAPGAGSRDTLAANAVAEEVELRSDSATSIRGWFVPGSPGGGAVVLLHGVRSSHRRMLARARFLHRAGYSVFLIDFRGHGWSGGGPITYGATESRDAHAALAYVRDRLPNERVAVIGVSMGGAASLLGPRPVGADALILESVYATIDDAVSGRAHAWLGPVGYGLAPLFLRHWLPRAGVLPAELRPVDRIARVKAPVFVLSGTDDQYTSLDEARALYERAGEPRAFWAVAGAAHEDLHTAAGAEYERRVLAFLGRHVRKRSARD